MDAMLKELEEYEFEAEKQELIESIKEAIINLDVDFLTQNEEWLIQEQSFLNSQQEMEKQEIADMSVVVELLENLRYAMEEMDIDASDAAMEALRQYEFGEGLQAVIDKLGTAVTNLDSDEVMELVEKIMKEI